jgi:hypothetical protein
VGTCCPDSKGEIFLQIVFGLDRSLNSVRK